MKTRQGYVSNSSSSSFIIFKWSSYPIEIQQKVLFPKPYVFEVWKKENIAFEETDFGYCIDWNKEKEKDDYDEEKIEKLDFSYVENRGWMANEDPEIDTMTLSTIMDNFDMEKWLQYVGIQKFKWTEF